MPHEPEELNADFLGGPPELFDAAGREQLVALLDHGLEFESHVLDIGCGCLRGARWILPILDAGHYCGIEPMEHMIAKGLEQFVPADLVEMKQPRFDHNDQFDFSVFDQQFTHFMARSIWTHASKPHIEKMLDGMVEWGAPGAVMLASFHPATLFGRKDYQGVDWVGRSHESGDRGAIAHRFTWVREAAARRGMEATMVARPPLREGGQVWCAVRKKG